MRAAGNNLGRNEYMAPALMHQKYRAFQLLPNVPVRIQSCMETRAIKSNFSLGHNLSYDPSCHWPFGSIWSHHSAWDRECTCIEALHQSGDSPFRPALLIQAVRRSSHSLDLVVWFVIAWSTRVDSADSLTQLIWYSLRHLGMQLNTLSTIQGTTGSVPELPTGKPLLA